MSIIIPFGSFLTQFDTAIMAAQTAAVSGLVLAVKAPIAMMAVIYFMIMGWRIACGDLERINSFTFDMAKIGLIFWFATDLPTFNRFVVGMFELGLPAAITTAVSGAGIADSGTVASVSGSIDRIWAHLWTMAAACWTQASIIDVSSRIIAALAVIVGGIGLVLIAAVYLIARFLLAVVVILGPVCIACAMFAPTRPIFERWIGKGVSLIVLQIAAVIVMQVVLSGTIAFMGTVNTNLDLATQLQNMIGMVVWLLLGAFAIWSLPTIAYSIGTGVAISFAPIAAAGFAAAGAAMGLASGLKLPGSGGDGGGDGGPAGANLSFARAELAGSGFGGGGGGTDSAGLTTVATSTSPAPPMSLSGSRVETAGSSGGQLLLPPPTPLLTYAGG